MVLKERFHLAYPRVLSEAGEHYLLPDAPGQGVRLYQAVDFPHRWSFVSQLVHDPMLSDSTPFRHDGHWWMLSGSRRSRGAPTDLRLFHADRLTGPWLEHPASPVVTNDAARTRPAGSIVNHGGRLYRMAQDCSIVYGASVRAFEILELSTERYREQAAAPTALLSGGHAWWTAGGMHHVDAHRVDGGRWIACVDGWHRSEPAGK